MPVRRIFAQVHARRDPISQRSGPHMSALARCGVKSAQTSRKSTSDLHTTSNVDCMSTTCHVLGDQLPCTAIPLSDSGSDLVASYRTATGRGGQEGGVMTQVGVRGVAATCLEIWHPERPGFLGTGIIDSVSSRSATCNDSRQNPNHQWQRKGHPSLEF